MAEAEPPQQSIQARIAALNLGQVGRAPGPVKISPRPPPPKPPIERSASEAPPAYSIRDNGVGNEPSAPNSRVTISPPTIRRGGGTESSNAKSPPPVPQLPPRRPSAQSPALPPRRPSEQLSRRDSQESISSVISSVSGLSTGTNGTSRTTVSRVPSMDGSRIRAPVYDPASLPPLPPKRTQEEKEQDRARMPAKSPSFMSSKFNSISKRVPGMPQRSSTDQSLPSKSPVLPQRPAQQPAERTDTEEPPQQPPRKLATTANPPMPSRPRNGYGDNGAFQSTKPPPIPLSTRPDLAKIMATKPKTSFVQPSVNVFTPDSQAISCLKCRDFSAVDAHAANFPRENVPSLDWLATQLTAPFSSQTDKARAVFTWLHHNIDYDVVAFFGNRVQSSTPVSTLNSGLAVCEGYAGLFTALATKAGMESIVVGGHGKGNSPPLHQPTIN